MSADWRDRSSDGGMPARRAVARWSARMVRREWRQHTLIVSLIAIVVAGTVVIGAAAYNIAPSAGQAEFGDADNILLLDDIAPDVLDDSLAAAAEAFGAVDAIGHRDVVLPGAARRIDYRSQDVDGVYGAPMIAVVDGRPPDDGSEAAITDDIGDVLGLSIGGSIDLDGTTRRIVGVVENPVDLDDDFVLLAPSELAGSESFELLVRGNDDDFRRYDSPGNEPIKVNSRGDIAEDVLAGVLMLLASTVLMLLVALVAAASFTVIAQRRLPQLGMLSAVGATQRNVRLVMIADGAAAGVIAAAIGAAVGLVVWFATVDVMEPVVGFRIDRSNVPWWLVAVSMVMAVIAATCAAWWPARTMSRIPTVTALTGRVPRPAPAHRSALSAVLLLVTGVVALRIGSNFGDRGPSTGQQLGMAIGTLLVVAGVLMVSPVLARWLGTLARIAPLSGRLALRDLSRYQARTGAALAAIGLALGIPAVIVASTAAAENQAGPGNLSGAQLLVRPDELDDALELPDADRVADIDAGAQAIADAVDGAVAVELLLVRDPSASFTDGMPIQPPLDVARQVDRGWMHLSNVYLATPEVLVALGLDDDAADGDDVVTAEGGSLYLLGTHSDGTPGLRAGRRIARTGTLPGTYSSLPDALVSSEVVDERGWETVRGGRWLIDVDHELTTDELATARELAAEHGFVIESRDDPGGSRMRLLSGLIGMVLALGVLATTIGLLRSDVANEMRTLTAAGATRSTRRGITAVIAGSLAALGAALGITAAYIGLVAGRLDDLTPLPWADLALIGLGTPLIAAGAAWLLSGGEPATIARRPID